MLEPGIVFNVVIDRFGLDANIQDQQDGTFLLKAQAAMSEGLVRWLFRCYVSTEFTIET